MDNLNQELIEDLLRVTWRNPAFMTIVIALIWFIPQLLIRRVLSKNYEKRKTELQKEKIRKLYPKTIK